MKTLTRSLAIALAGLAGTANAEQIVTIDGETYFLSHLTENCQAITDDPAAQIACFGAISALLEEQPAEETNDPEAINLALDDLRTLASFSDGETGLQINGAGCNIHLMYYANYFHISRRNISELDLFSAEFDASKLQIEKTMQVQGGAAPLFRGVLDDAATAIVRGGAVLDSAGYGFAPRAPSATLDDYASEVVGQLPAAEKQTFDFVLIHPANGGSTPEIWAAFQTYVAACKG